MTKTHKLGIGKAATLGVATVATVAALGLVGCGGSTSTGAGTPVSADSATTEAKAEEKEPYTISEENLAKDEFSAKITGTLTNNTDKDYDYIQIEYNLYDADGAQIGTAFANTNNLKAGGVWKFEALCTVEPDKIAKFERTGVDGFNV